MEFLGFPRPDGSVGIRNYVLVIPSGLIATKICESVNGVRTIVTANFALGCTARDRQTVARTIVGLGANPNVAAVIVHNGSPGSDYPELSAEALASQIAKTGKPVEVLDVAREGGAFEAIARGVKVARHLVHQASRMRREPFGLDKLCLGVKCGWSDPTSGMAGNPAIGYLFDRIVDAGGTALFGETTEIIGAEHVLARRAANEQVAKAILDAADFIDRRALATGEDIRTVNPIPANIEAGISTLEEKSLGAIHKAGSRPIQGVLKYGERPPGKGLYFVDNWASHLSIYLGYAAAGAQMGIFQLGGAGMPNLWVLNPSASAIAPLIWTTANPTTYSRCEGSIDFYAGTVIEGKETPEEAGERLLRVVVEIASGALACSETLNYVEPADYYLLDPVF